MITAMMDIALESIEKKRAIFDRPLFLEQKNYVIATCMVEIFESYN